MFGDLNIISKWLLEFCFFFFLVFIWLCWVLVAARELLAVACEIKFPDQGLNLGPLHWEHRILANGSPPRGSEQKRDLVSSMF